MEIVGRAELKLADAVKAFGYDFRGKTVLDIGSSTGGFTELALRMGAKRVIAVEKGTHQMKAPLRFDPRVELYEKTDIFRVVAGAGDTCGNALGRSALFAGAKSSPQVAPALALSASAKSSEQVVIDTPDTILADVSFVSLKDVLTHVRKCLAGRETDCLVMLKPQFEARPEQLNRGVVKNERIRREIIRSFEQWLARNGFVVIKKRDNEVVGKVGKNQERFYWLRCGAAAGK